VKTPRREPRRLDTVRRRGRNEPDRAIVGKVTEEGWCKLTWTVGTGPLYCHKDELDVVEIGK
jgi:hypothetical protein